jgi:hypothetical protein
MRVLPLLLSALLVLLPTAALADPITATKSVAMVSDPMGNLIPRAIPGAVLDYTATLANPLRSRISCPPTSSCASAIWVRAAAGR